MWLGGKNRIQQQDAVFLAEDAQQYLWMADVDGLGGHPGGAEASQICCDVLREEMEIMGFDVNDALRDKIRDRMPRDKLLMSDSKGVGGACMALVCANGSS